jgi:hypothetical protein
VLEPIYGLLIGVRMHSGKIIVKTGAIILAGAAQYASPFVSSSPYIAKSRGLELQG